MSDSYSSESVLREYLLFHYGTAEEILSLALGPSDGLGFAERTVSELLDTSDDSLSQGSALDLGCAVGRSTFELARHCGKVTGVDFSSKFIRAAEILREKGQVSYDYVTHGERVISAIARIPEGVDSSVVNFLSCDVCSLPENLGNLDVVHAANLICRLSAPGSLLERLPELVRPGGQLLIATPFTWLEEFTSRDEWLGGRRDGPASAFALKASLESAFRLEKEINLPFLLREHERKFQYGVSLGMRWRRLEC